MKKLVIVLCLFYFQSHIYAQPYTVDDFVGSYSGIWHNNTFNSEGATTMSLSNNANDMTAQMILDMDGNVLGGSDPDPMILDGTYTDTEFTVSATTAVLGDFTLSVDNQGNVTGQAINVPNNSIEKVEFSGTATPTGMNLNYVVTFSEDAGGGNADGYLTLTKNSSTVVVNDDNNFADNFVLNQNFPNPFNPTTVISFNMPNDGYVTLSVYNLIGEQVIELVDQYINSGEHSVTWDGRDQFGNEVSGGTYIYNLKSDNFSFTKKMIFLK